MQYSTLSLPTKYPTQSCPYAAIYNKLLLPRACARERHDATTYTLWRHTFYIHRQHDSFTQTSAWTYTIHRKGNYYAEKNPISIIVSRTRNSKKHCVFFLHNAMKSHKHDAQITAGRVALRQVASDFSVLLSSVVSYQVTKGQRPRVTCMDGQPVFSAGSAVLSCWTDIILLIATFVARASSM